MVLSFKILRAPYDVPFLILFTSKGEMVAGPDVCTENEYKHADVNALWKKNDSIHWVFDVEFPTSH